MWMTSRPVVTVSAVDGRDNAVKLLSADEE